jgi:hypothetical protein
MLSIVASTTCLDLVGELRELAIPLLNKLGQAVGESKYDDVRQQREQRDD